MEKMLDLYTDYLLSSFGQTSATGLSNLVDGSIQHDTITRFLSNSNFTSKDLWVHVKPLVREHQSSEGCLIFDDTIIEKAFTDENDLISWHWDHSKHRSIKGTNLLSAFYYTEGTVTQIDKKSPLRIPVAFETIKKTVRFCDVKTQKEKRASPISKNELMRQMIIQCIANGLIFKYVLADSWFSSVENLKFIADKKKLFIFDIQSNRLSALSEKDRNAGNWTRIDELNISNNVPVKVWLKDLEFPILLNKQVFTNKDNSTGDRFLISNDFSLTDEQFTTIYKKRWSVEEYHKSLKQNASVAKSPTRKIQTQSNHLFASIIAYIKLEKLKFANKMNHFAMKTKIYNQALKAAFKELTILKNVAHA
jgi:Transposase DDE domain